MLTFTKNPDGQNGIVHHSDGQMTGKCKESTKQCSTLTYSEELIKVFESCRKFDANREFLYSIVRGKTPSNK